MDDVQLHYQLTDKFGLTQACPNKNNDNNNLFCVVLLCFVDNNNIKTCDLISENLTYCAKKLKFELLLVLNTFYLC